MIEFGILLPTQVPSGTEIDAAFMADLASLARHSMECGAAGVFALQHFGSNLQTLQPWPLLSYLAGSMDSQVTVGSCVSLLTTQNPLQVAEEVATLDHLTGGRVILGVGAGYREPELAAFGVALDTRGPRMEESIRLIRDLWSGKRISWQGTFWHLEDVISGLAPFTAEGPPIWIGAQHKSAIRRAARIGDAWIAPGNSPDPTWIEYAQRTYLDGLAEVGKDASASRHPILLEYCANDDREVVALARENLKREYRDYARYAALSWFEDRFDEMSVSFAVGSVAAVGERIQSLADLGFDYFLLRPKWSEFPSHFAEDSVRVFGSEYSRVTGAPRYF
ncbi:MAG: LLM class flavin-dependent oxidoreductase [Candidatus Nanopelagicales bacterium]